MTKKSKDNNSVGTTEYQITLLTERINSINTHLDTNKKDNSSRRGLLLLVSKRRKLLKYYRRSQLEGYKTLIEKLKIRK